MMDRLILRLAASIAFWRVYLLARTLGFSVVVRYLRNPNPAITIRLLRAFGAQVGAGVSCRRSLAIDNAYEDRQSAGDFSHLRIGAGCFLGDGVYVDLAGTVTLEDGAVLAGRVALITHLDTGPAEEVGRHLPRQTGDIRIGAGAWIGFGATILHGVTVGAAAAVAAGALVRGDVPARTLFAGVPARRVRDLEAKA